MAGQWVQWLVLLATFVVVGFFLIRDHRRSKGYFAGEKVGVQRTTKDDRDWSALVAAAREKADAMARPAIALSLSDTPISTDAHSSLGGRPSLPAGQPWPLDDAGEPMIFLAQINFADMPVLAGYPTGGLLSFFVKDNDMNGCAFPSVGNDGFLVTYYEEAKDLIRHDLPQKPPKFSPLNAELTQKGRRLEGEPASGPISAASADLRSITKDWHSDAPDILWDEFYDGLAEAKQSPLYYGGHPDFTQDDFRRPGDDPEYSEVLLQMGYVYDREKGIDICWGDAGETCFLITKEDLAAKRFDRVVYYWDCT